MRIRNFCRLLFLKRNYHKILFVEREMTLLLH